MRRTKHFDSVDSPDMTPMLDVVFIMLIFFIVTTSFVKEDAIDWLSLSNQADPKPPVKQKNPLVLEIKSNGDLVMENQLINLDAVRARTQSLLAKRDVEHAIVKVESQVTAQILVSAVDSIKLGGVEKVSVAKIKSSD
ncbi:biopolymer transporter ExbD [Aliikangiella sp. G2MR2-5]|uniref:ExbD/TolR family protein n=1 Tax=Aliikangiella sp. G2MR2-5 TaxID=2788943 RepID=UPI0018A9A8D8|nr:biopolymer transporter ExbD [Aliikangiella sp. G2MR2-5]